MSIWTPSVESLAACTLTAFRAEVVSRHGIDLPDYRALWRWSVADIPAFWGSVWDFFDLGARPPDAEILPVDRMPGAVWFPGTRVNFAQRCLAPGAPGATAMICVGEDGTTRRVTRAELRAEVARVAAGLRALGIEPGDHVAAYLTNRLEAVVGLLACAAVGAVWTIVAPDLGVAACRSRLEQVDPVVLLAAPSYRYGGRVHDRCETLDELIAALPTLRHVVHVAGAEEKGSVPGGLAGSESAATTTGRHSTGEGKPDVAWSHWDELPEATGELTFADTAFDDPLWVLWSSGTTGSPKGIVHGHGGITLELLKALALGGDVHPDDVFFFVTSTSWMVWNFLVGGLLLGTTIVLYDGSPTHPDVDGAWRVAADVGASVMGAGAAYLQAGHRAQSRPGQRYDLSRLRILFQTGSTMPPATWQWVMDAVSPHVWLQSISGGTDVCSVLAGANPFQPVPIGRLVGPSLGVALAAWDASGHEVVGSEGELVITRPMPSMPLRFVGDPDGNRLTDAYFGVWPGVWRHGDFVTIEHDGSIVISGRSDATLNRYGVRMGSADIYGAIEPLPGVADSLVVGVDLPDGSYWMPLFVVPAAGVRMDDELRERIRQRIRQQLSPRHLPDEIIEAPDIPRTLTGKKLEVPVKRLLQDVLGTGTSERDPAGLEWYLELARTRRAATDSDTRP